MDKMSIGRIIALVVVLINAALNLFGFQTIPVEFGEHLTALILIVVSLWTAWKNNYLTRKGQEQKKVLEKSGLK